MPCTVKKGYPPQSMTLVPELPFSSLGLKPGEQIIVGQNAGPSVSKRNPESNGGPVSSRSGNNATAIYPSVPMPPVQTLPKPSVPSQDHVEAEGGVLVHRVSIEYRTRVASYISPLLQVVPDDNSCLFTSIALIFQQDMAKSQQMRQSMSSRKEVKVLFG
jgi:ubiquitin thioesterase OTU1